MQYSINLPLKMSRAKKKIKGNLPNTTKFPFNTIFMLMNDNSHLQTHTYTRILTI